MGGGKEKEGDARENNRERDGRQVGRKMEGGWRGKGGRMKMKKGG